MGIWVNEASGLQQKYPHIKKNAIFKPVLAWAKWNPFGQRFAAQFKDG